MADSYPWNMLEHDPHLAIALAPLSGRFYTAAPQEGLALTPILKAQAYTNK